MRPGPFHRILPLLWMDQLALVHHVRGIELRAHVHDATAGSRSHSHSKQQPTVVTVPAEIDLPSDEELAERTLSWAHQIQAATSERNTAESAGKAAESHERAMEAGSQAAASHLRAREYRRRVQVAAHSAQDDQRRANKAARATRAFVGKMEIIAKAAADQAVAEVMRDAIAELNEEVKKTIETYKAEKEADYKRAKEAAMASAAPFKQAKMLAERNVNDYLLRGREAAAAVTALKWDAYRIAGAANGYQYKGQVVTAQEEMVKAHDLMNQASQLESQAKAYQLEAQKLQGNLNTRSYDSAAGVAAAYGAYAANPSGDAIAIPPPPAPLES